jgi:hypothetical protein
VTNHSGGTSGDEQAAGNEEYEGSQPALTLQQLQSAWEKVKKRVRGRNETGPKTAAFLQDYALVGVEQGSDAVIVSIQPAHLLHYHYLQQNRKYCADVEWAFKQEFDVPCRVRLLAPEA